MFDRVVDHRRGGTKGGDMFVRIQRKTKGEGRPWKNRLGAGKSRVCEYRKESKGTARVCLGGPDRGNIGVGPTGEECKSETTGMADRRRREAQRGKC